MLIRRVSRVLIGFRHMARYSLGSLDSIEFQTDLTFEEQNKILNILNGCGRDELSKFNISKIRIKNIESWKNKKGPFRSLDEVLEVDGFGQRALEKVCDNIMEGNCGPDRLNRSKGDGRFKLLVKPPIPPTMLNDFKTVVGVYLSPMSMSWIKMRKADNSFSNWGYQNFLTLPEKLLKDNTFDLAVFSMQKLPAGDIYILESVSNGSPANKNQATIISHSQLAEMASMLIALLNTSMKHNISLASTNKGCDQQIIENRVFFMRSMVPARLFKTLVGNEKVSAINKVTELIENDRTHEVPCSPVVVAEHLKQSFMAQTPVTKELLSQALILVVSFMDLYVHQNPASLASLLPQRPPKK